MKYSERDVSISKWYLGDSTIMLPFKVSHVLFVLRRYAGGKRFVMVRKILEVKEVVRVAEENYLARQFRKGETLSDEPPQLE